MNLSAIKTVEASTAPMAAAPDLSQHSELLESFFKIPSIDKGWLFSSKTGNNLEAMVAMNQVNLVANSKRKYVSSVHIPREVNETACSWSAFPFELTGVSLVVPSLSGGKLLVIRNAEPTGKDGSTSTKLEVWSSAQLIREIIVPTSVHGSVYADGWFEGVSWSQDESYIAYVAEEPASNRPVFGKSLKCDEKPNENDPHIWKGQGDWQEDWGESYTGKRRPILFVADLQNGNVQKVEGLPDDLNAGQVVWAPPPLQGRHQLLVFVGWRSASENFQTYKKLGMKYCFNRPCALYSIEAPQLVRLPDSLPCLQNLTRCVTSAFMPRFSPDGELLIFLSSQEAVRSGAHNSTNSLHCLPWPVKVVSDSVLDIKEVVPVTQPPGGFPGLYCTSFLTNPWLSDRQTLLLSSTWFSTHVILAVNIKSGEVSRITPIDDSSSWNLFSVCGDYILAARSSFGKPQSLKLGVCQSASDVPGFGQTWNWLDIHNPFWQLPDEVERVLSSITYDILDIPIPNHEKLSKKGPQDHFEAIFVSSGASKTSSEPHAKNPVIVVVHGGPHAVYTTGFSRSFSFLSALGFNLLLVNYRGSTGFGEEPLQSLPGKAGCQDVADVLEALDFAIANGLADPHKVAVFGGSHGGFLSTHLIGQAPDRFVTAAVINPVCNISSMVGVTDIPDWCYVETFGRTCFDAYSDAPSSRDLDKFYHASPLAHISKVKVPTLFLLGAQDRRVPISNGFQYVQALRSRGLKVKVIVFPEDAHPIDRPQSEFESWLNIGSWFKTYLELRTENDTS